jgi:D-alanine-D-alanine ligase
MKTVLVIFGGRSPEHDVSVVSALAAVVRPLELLGEYRVEAVYISKDGAWYWDDRLKDIALYREGQIDAFIQKASSPWLEFNGGLRLVKQQSLGRLVRRSIDVVFPVMHGSYGEDGSLMGLLEMAGVPYVGCDVPSSAIAMDKVLAKQVADSAGISTGAWLWFTAQAFRDDAAATLDRIKTLSYPLFVKPAHAGSSIGITKVDSESELQNAIEVAAHYDDKIIVEQAVNNLIEVTLPIMGNAELVPALLEQPMTHDDKFFDFETKYMNGGKKKGGKIGVKGAKIGAQGYSTLPAALPKDLYAKAEKLGLDVYRALGCTGTARVDMLIDGKTEEVYFNEINPMPGSLYAHNWREAGISGTELVTRLIAFAEERHTDKQRIQTSFATNFLKQF